MTPKQDFLDAIEKYKPIHTLLLFSGGHDSLCSSHYTADLLDCMGLPYSVYHGDTGIGIQETQDFVRRVCDQYGWKLDIRKPSPPYDYETLVKKHGFPGPPSHPMMYRNLKDKPLRAFVTHELKSTPYAREHVLLVTGIRSSESVIRMGYSESVKKEYSRVWCSPIMDWTNDDCKRYIAKHNLPQNPVKKAICISGECLCGCFAKKEEPAEIKAAFPHAWKKIKRLAKYSPWPWGTGGKAKHNKRNSNTFRPMCVGCESE